jgi:hypothetical protein
MVATVVDFLFIYYNKLYYDKLCPAQVMER